MKSGDIVQVIGPQYDNSGGQLPLNAYFVVDDPGQVNMDDAFSLVNVSSKGRRIFHSWAFRNVGNHELTKLERVIYGLPE